MSKPDIVALTLHQIERDPGNVFTHEDGDLQRLTALIQEHGFLAPFVVDADSRHTVDGVETYTLVGGEARHEAARCAGLTEVPVVLARFESPEARRAAAIGLNGDFGRFDDAKLTAALKDLAEADYDLDLCGLSPMDMDKLLNDTELTSAPLPGEAMIGYRCPKCFYEWSGQPRPQAA